MDAKARKAHKANKAFPDLKATRDVTESEDPKARPERPASPEHVDLRANADNMAKRVSKDARATTPSTVLVRDAALMRALVVAVMAKPNFR